MYIENIHETIRAKKYGILIWVLVPFEICLLKLDMLQKQYSVKNPMYICIYLVPQILRTCVNHT